MTYTAAELRKAFIEADRKLRKKPVSVADVEATLQPYYACTGIADREGEMVEAARSMIFALTADAHRSVGDAVSAAEWYRRASRISPGGHFHIYAHLVVKHRLADHYGDALVALELGDDQWGKRPLLERVILTIGGWRMWLDPEGREILANKSEDLRFLREHV
jgi:hypothetical protein